MDAKSVRKKDYIFWLLGVSNFRELSRIYTIWDQILMKDCSWNIDDTKLITNIIRNILEEIDIKELNEDDRGWYAEILWFWYHHATSCLSWDTHRELAKQYSVMALHFQEISQPIGSGNPNRITRLLYYLVHDRLSEAKEWMASFPQGADRIEHETGLSVIRDYEEKYR